MEDEKAALVAKASWSEHQRTAKWCAKNPGATYHTATTGAKNLADPAATAK